MQISCGGGNTNPTITRRTTTTAANPMVSPSNTPAIADFSYCLRTSVFCTNVEFVVAIQVVCALSYGLRLVISRHFGGFSSNILVFRLCHLLPVVVAWTVAACLVVVAAILLCLLLLDRLLFFLRPPLCQYTPSQCALVLFFFHDFLLHFFHAIFCAHFSLAILRLFAWKLAPLSKSFSSCSSSSALLSVVRCPLSLFDMTQKHCRLNDEPVINSLFTFRV